MTGKILRFVLGLFLLNTLARVGILAAQELKDSPPSLNLS